MQIDLMLAALQEYLSAKKDFETGNAEQNSVDEARRRFASLFYEILDAKIANTLDARRQHQSIERIEMADTINSAMNSTASTFKSMAALNSAPMPPEDISDPEKMTRWKEAYAEWYETTRKGGLTIG
jgi:hypothetical protein